MVLVIGCIVIHTKLLFMQISYWSADFSWSGLEVSLCLFGAISFCLIGDHSVAGTEELNPRMCPNFVTDCKKLQSSMELPGHKIRHPPVVSANFFLVISTRLLRFSLSAPITLISLETKHQEIFYYCSKLASWVLTLKWIGIVRAIVQKFVIILCIAA